jgi:hypothetical protein
MELQGERKYSFDTSDLSVWVSAVAPLDRWIFNSVIDMLWPNSVARTREGAENASSVFEDLPSSLNWNVNNAYLDWAIEHNARDNLALNPAVLETSFQETVDGILSGSEGLFQFSELAHLPGGRSIPERNGVHYYDYDPNGPLTAQNSSSQFYWDPSQHGEDWSSNPCDIHTPGIDVLRATSLFLCAIQFLSGQYGTKNVEALCKACANSSISVIGQLGLLILTLSGIQFDCLSEPTIAENGSHHRLVFARYLETVKFRVLNELRLDCSFEKHIPVCKVVDKILEAGWLKTIRDVENYLIIVAKVFSPKMQC